TAEYQNELEVPNRNHRKCIHLWTNFSDCPTGCDHVGSMAPACRALASSREGNPRRGRGRLLFRIRSAEQSARAEESYGLSSCRKAAGVFTRRFNGCLC